MVKTFHRMSVLQFISQVKHAQSNLASLSNLVSGHKFNRLDALSRPGDFGLQGRRENRVLFENILLLSYRELDVNYTAFGALH